MTPGEQVGGRFTIVGELGRGGMAVVYLAEDDATGGRVALKVLHPHLTGDPAAETRLRREVKAGTLFESDGALLATSLHELDGRLALSMPVHTGVPLHERVQTKGTLSSAELEALGRRLAQTLADAHRVGLLHRDVTPNNVLLDQAGDAVLTDFGLVRIAGGTRTRNTGMLGTPGYAAPETYEGDRSDPRSDLYGLGAVLYLAATGSPPFGSGDPVGVLKRQLAGDVPDLAAQRPDLAPWLVGLIEQLLSPRADARPGTAAEVLQRLQDRTEPLKPPRSMAVADNSLVELPAGTWTVVVKEKSRQRRRRGRLRNRRTGWNTWFPTPELDDKAERQLLAAVCQEAGVPAESLGISEAMLDKQFRLVDGVDKATAERLAQAAEVAGFTAKPVDRDRGGNPIAQAALMLPALIPVVWIVFAFSSAFNVDQEMMLPFAIIASIVFPMLAGIFGGESIPDNAGLAVGRQLGRREEGAPDTVAEPTTEEARAVDRVTSALNALEAALGTASLPEIALVDLRGTLKELRRTADEVGEGLLQMEAAPELQDTSWIAGRLRRLETLERSGQAVDLAERAQLERTLAAAEQAQSAAESLESRRIAAMAQLMEITHTANTLHAQVAGAGDRQVSVEALSTRLKQQADAAVRARQEAARRAQSLRG